MAIGVGGTLDDMIKLPASIGALCVVISASATMLLATHDAAAKLNVAFVAFSLMVELVTGAKASIESANCFAVM